MTTHRRPSLNSRSTIGFRIFIVSCIAITTSVVESYSAEPKTEAPWRSLPLIERGKIASNWTHIGWGSFVVDDGAVRTECDPKGLGLLVYNKERLGNCQVRVVFKSKDKKSNAGVYVRIADGILDQVGNPGAAFDRDDAGTISGGSSQQMRKSSDKAEGPWFAVHHGYEVQIMDAADPFHRTGAIYSLAPSSAISPKPPNEWKTMVITLDASWIRVDLDGQRITNFDSENTDVAPANEWYEPRREVKRPKTGFLGLQNHDPGDVVWFKEIAVRPLP